MGSTMLHNADLPEWLREGIIFSGAEGDGDDTGGDGDDGGDDGDDGEGTDDGNDSGGEGGDDEDNPKRAGSKAALLRELAAERKKRQKLEREKAAAKKLEEDAELAKQDAVTQEKTKREQAEARAQKLAEGFRTSEVNRVVREVARELHFHDPSDALVSSVLSAIEVEQDEDDPSVVEVDEASVQRAVKSLAAKKKHLVKSGTDDDEPSGSPFGGRRKGKKPTKDEEYIELYPSLR